MNKGTTSSSRLICATTPRSPAPCNCSSTGIGMGESSKSGLAGPAAARVGAAAAAKSVVRKHPARPEGTPEWRRAALAAHGHYDNRQKCK
ncbi:MAG: hypothetical protein VB143_09415 [Burkholderia sp.]